MNASLDPQLPKSRSRIRMDARLDAATRAKVDELATYFHQPRAVVVCRIMQWGLSREQAEMRDGGASEGPVRHLSLYIESELHQWVQKVASAAGMKIAPWLRAMVRQMTIDDFPASWQEATFDGRSHDSRTYGPRFMLRLDSPSETKLQQLVTQFGASKAAIIRQLIIQATPEDFPNSWHIRAARQRERPYKEKLIMRTHGHTTVWGTQVEVGRIGGHAGWYRPLKNWWAARQAPRRQAHLAPLDACWDAQHEAVRALRAEAAPDMAAAQGALTVAIMLYGLQQ